MVSPVFSPAPPVPATWAPPGGWYNAGAASVQQPQQQQPQANPASDPNAYLNQLMAIYNSPIGRDAQAAMQQTISMNVRQALAAMKNERDRIAIQKGQAEADRWYKEQSLQLARDAHQLAVQTQQQNYALAAGGLTGQFNGQPTLAALGQQGQMTGYYNGTPTLANLGQQAMYTGLYNGTPTLQAQNQQQQYALQQAQLALAQLTQQQQHELAQGTLNLATLTQQQRNAIEQAQLGLTQAGITGEFNGRPTLAALAQQQNFGLAQAGVTGTYGGTPTEAARQFNLNYALQQGQQTGYQNGAPTLAREQGAANTALQAAQLGASLRGPGDWAQYLQAANAVGSNPAVSGLLASAPGGLGAMQGEPGGPMTLGKLFSDYGVMPGQGPSQPWQGGSGNPLSMGGGDQGDLARQAGFTPASPGQQMWAGGSPTFNEQTGQYGGGAGGFMEQTPGGGWQQGGGSSGTGSYSSAPAGGMRMGPKPSLWNPQPGGGFPNVDPVTGGSTLAGGAITNSASGGGMPEWQQGWNSFKGSYAQPQQQTSGGWNPYSMTGAIGQAASAPRVTNQQLGLSDQEADQLKGYFNSPNSAPGTWWTSKSTPQKKYLSGLNAYWGGDPETFQERERNARPRQGSAWAA